MVLFGTDHRKMFYSTKSAELDSNNIYNFLVITTTEITNEILKMVDTTTTKNIIFKAPSFWETGELDFTFDFKVDIWVWNIFVRNIEYLEFRGKLINNQLTAKHFEGMKNVKGLYIGATNYALFDNEDISKLPLIKFILLNGYGLVIESENMKKWLEVLNMNGCVYERCI